MPHTHYKSVPLLSALAFLASGFAFAGEDSGDLDKNKAAKVYPAKPIYSPYAGRKFPTRPLFGDTHLHTAASFDAGAFGVTHRRWDRRGHDHTLYGASTGTARRSAPASADADILDK